MNTHFRFELNIINENFICSSILRALFISSSFRFYFHSHDLYPFFRSSHFFCGAYSAFVASFDWLNNINNNNKKRYVNFLLQFHCFFFWEMYNFSFKCTTTECNEILWKTIVIPLYIKSYFQFIFVLSNYPLHVYRNAIFFWKTHER